jgi:UTP--glucose-1-phosphate uridylyltransferase
MPLIIDDGARAELTPYGLDEALLAQFAERAKRTGGTERAVLAAITPPSSEDLVALPVPGSPERARLAAIGRAAIGRGRVGVVILAGGVATGFGGVAKATVPVLDGKSFLELEADDVVNVSDNLGGPVPLYVMTSFATHAAIEEHVRKKRLATDWTPITCVPLPVSLRLTPDGALFRAPDGGLSPYATGDGDLTFALRRSGALAAFRARGGELLCVSSVDNLAATLDAAVVGLHLERGAKITVEVAREEKGDEGGVPARVDGVPQIVETSRLPAGFDRGAIPLLDTHTLVLDAAAIDHDLELPYHRVEKTVEGRPMIQFERLVGDLTATLPSTFVQVERDGRDGRFSPVKDPDDLARRLPDLRAIVASKRWQRRYAETALP